MKITKWSAGALALVLCVSLSSCNRLQPKSPADDTEQQKAAAELDSLRNEVRDLKTDNNDLHRQIFELQKKLAAAQEAKAAPAAPPPPSAPAATAHAAGFSTNPITAAAEKLVGKETRTYTVEKGDTLSSISLKYYKTRAHWKDIADANHNALGNSTMLKVGQVLIIPK